MFNKSTLTILAVSGFALIPFVSHSGEKQVVENSTINSATSTVQLERARTLAAAERRDGSVVDNIETEMTGFRNHLVDIDDLTKVTSDADVVDTYTFEYNGKVYTNKIVDTDK
ncbi:MAG: hypothetical protein EX271_01580 [Acidimicrobiales bacterium]|nr:hypothetical protein [Hyphomonadaceae bacterium]RZV44502.1 MAG: hypothetical protein EX271_01580 [Acidimicrobiales bacterium]